MRRTVATVCTALALAVSLTGGPAQAGQATKAGRTGRAAPVAAACTVAAQPGWYGTLTDDSLSADTRHHVVKPGGEVREVVRFELAERSRVHLNVRDSDGKYIRGPVNLGVLPAGWNYWTWTGHANGGATVPDGDYSVNIYVTAVSDGYYYSTGAPALVHRRYHPGSVNLSHTTVYPRSTAVRDSINLGVRPPRSAKLTTRVRNQAGKVVFTRSSQEAHTFQRVKWDGRDRSGRPLPAGTYYVTSSGVDHDCFSGTSKPRRVVVSAKKLVNHTRTLTLPAADALKVDEGPGCMDCGPDCGTVTPSGRFGTEGALSFRSGPAPCGPLQAWQATRVSDYIPHDRAPRGYGTVKVSVFGGPTTPGAADQGELTVDHGAVRDTYYGGYTQRRTTSVMTGPDVSAHTTTSATVPIGVLGGAAPGFGWRFTTQNGASYDIATLTFTYTYLTPAS